MITMNEIGLNGRLGNQMFQYAALLGIARKNNFKYGINYSNDFNLKLEDIPEDIHINQKILTLSRLFKLSAEDSSHINLPTIAEPHLHFCEELFQIKDNVNLHGYFQTEKYFKNKKEEILNLFEFEDSFLNMVTSKYKDLLANNPIGVQIRTYSRGMIDPRHIHCDVLENEAYLKESFKYFGKNKIFLVTTDNVEYTKKRIPNKENIYILDSNNLYEEFCLLTLCSGIISSASSFGWWASYLNKNKNKKIIMPQKWFNVKDDWYDTRDIYPEGVIIL